MFDTDDEVFRFVRAHLYVAAVCDILDKLGLRQQAMHQRLRPLLPDIRNCGFVGRAYTMRWMETEYIVEEDPYGVEIDAVDGLGPGDVAVHSTDYSGTNAPWGELMTIVAKRNGTVGCVCDSQVRDCVRIIEMGFPVYCAGIRPVDSLGRARMMDRQVPVRCGEVLVCPGDLVFADFDGIVAVPRKVEQDVLALAREKAGKESLSRKALLEGRSLRQVYDTYRVL